MTADRDALVQLIAPHLSGGPVGSVGRMAAGWFAEQIANEILAAGWRPVGDRSDELIKNWRDVEVAPGVFAVFVAVEADAVGD